MITPELAEQILRNTIKHLMPNAKKFLLDLIQHLINSKLDEKEIIIIVSLVAVFLFIKARTWLTDLNEKYQFYQ